jgi:hypothetical protein
VRGHYELFVGFLWLIVRDLSGMALRYRRGSAGLASPFCPRPGRVVLKARPRSVDQTQSLAAASPKREFFQMYAGDYRLFC